MLSLFFIIRLISLIGLISLISSIKKTGNHLSLLILNPLALSLQYTYRGY